MLEAFWFAQCVSCPAKACAPAIPGPGKDSCLRFTGALRAWPGFRPAGAEMRALAATSDICSHLDHLADNPSLLAHFCPAPASDLK